MAGIYKSRKANPEVWIHDEAAATSRLSVMRIIARQKGGNGCGVALEIASQSRLRLIKAKVRHNPSPGQDLEATASERFTIGNFQVPVCQTRSAILGPAEQAL
jgi:hypothetical protein